jgi:hypothetical protein
VGVVDWVYLPTVMKVMSLQVVLEAGKCMTNGATITGIWGGGGSFL